MSGATSVERPAVLPVKPEGIPSELKALPQWLVWKLELSVDRWTKVPYQAKHPRRKASSTDPGTWSTFDEALAAHERGEANGIGFVPLGTDPYIAVDLDNCRDTETGEVKPWAAHYVDRFGSHTEISPSGTGVRIIAKGRLKVTEDGQATGRTRSKTGDFEVYDGLTARLEQGGRYVTVTGHALYPWSIEERQTELEQIYDEVFSREDEKQPNDPSARPNAGNTGLIEKIRASKQGAKFERLWQGDTSGYRADDNRGHSEADLALCNILGWWTNYDVSETDALFRQSRLYRAKWDEARGAQTYGEITILYAFGDKGRGDGYDPSTARVRVNSRPETASAAVDPDRPLHTFKNTDFGNAERLNARHGQDLLYCHEAGWYVWDGTRWKQDPSASEVERRAKETLRGGYAEAARIENDEIRRAFTEFLVKSENRARITAMVELLKSEPGIGIEINDFDRDPYLLNCLNGTVDLRTGELRPHRREDFITQLVPKEFHPEATCPTWDDFQVKITGGSAELVNFKQKAFGYALTGTTLEQAIFICYGTGANGKSTELEVLRELLGDYAKGTEFASFEQQRKDSIRNDLARLRGARFVTAVESDQGSSLSEGTVKSLTGGDTITARFLHKEYFEFTPAFTVFLATNHKPRIRGTDHGIWRRIRLIPYNVTIPTAEQDKRLKDKLLAELPGILAWAVEGCRKWLKDGLASPVSVQTATESYREEMDTLAEFISEYFEVGDALTVPKRDMRDLYLRHCDESGNKPMSTTALKQALLERGYAEGRTADERYWEGLGLTNAAENVLLRQRGPQISIASRGEQN